MDSTVKAAMLKSSQTMVIPGNTLATTPATPRTTVLRRAHSIESIASPRLSRTLRDQEHLEPPHPPFAGGQVSAHHLPSVDQSPTPRKSSAHIRGLSYDAPNIFSRSQVHLPASHSTLDLSSTKLIKEKSGAAKNISPTKFFSILSSTSSTQLDVENIKKLRLLLRNETARCGSSMKFNEILTNRISVKLVSRIFGSWWVFSTSYEIE